MQIAHRHATPPPRLLCVAVLVVGCPLSSAVLLISWPYVVRAMFDVSVRRVGWDALWPGVAGGLGLGLCLRYSAWSCAMLHVQVCARAAPRYCYCLCPRRLAASASACLSMSRASGSAVGATVARPGALAEPCVLFAVRMAV
jgi:hypothetical protein